ncbi:MAG TPA: 50S ribosomal protein L23 [Candidatus Saccharimonadales bacterium]|nr:50S ribosomal protein L23 [Candidatus Saccharimonadales bacterium]
MTLKPRISEKVYSLSQTSRTYAVEVPGDANKDTIAKAVSAQFKVTVETVNIVNVKGKAKRTVRKGGRPIMGKRSDIKKAYVTLKEGDKLPFFNDPEEEAKKDKKSEKKTDAKKEKEKK